MMVFTLLVAATVAAEPIRVAAPGLSSHGMDAKSGDFYSDQVAQQLSFHGLRVITRSEVAAMLGHERQRQLLGCQDESGACAVELAGALGSDALLLGEIAKIGDRYRMSIRLVSAKNGEKLSTAVVTGTSEDTVLDAMGQMASRLARETTAKVRGEQLPTDIPFGVTTQRSGVKRFFWIPAAAGGLALVGGGVAYVQAKSRYDQLRSGTTLVEPQGSQIRNEGQSWQMLSLAGFAVGTAALATAAGMYFFGSDSVIEAGVAFGPSGGDVRVGGTFQ